MKLCKECPAETTIKPDTDFSNIPVRKFAPEIMLTHQEQGLENLSHFPVVLMGCTQPSTLSLGNQRQRTLKLQS